MKKRAHFQNNRWKRRIKEEDEVKESLDIRKT